MTHQGKTTAWESYEQVAHLLLNQIRFDLGLERVEGKQHLLGIISGTDWEVDAKGLCQDSGSFLLIECRNTKSRQSQAKIAALAY